VPEGAPDESDRVGPRRGARRPRPVREGGGRRGERGRGALHGVRPGPPRPLPPGGRRRGVGQPPDPPREGGAAADRGRRGDAAAAAALQPGGERGRAAVVEGEGACPSCACGHGRGPGRGVALGRRIGEGVGRGGVTWLKETREYPPAPRQKTQRPRPGWAGPLAGRRLPRGGSAAVLAAA